MKIAIAQIKPTTGDIAANITLHLKYVQDTIEQGVALIVFPELSLTGYEPNLAATLVTDLQDTRFDVIQTLSDQNMISIGLGVPIRQTEGISISMLLFQPKQPRQIYSKKYLHADEEPFFVSRESPPILKVGDLKIGLAICYELFVAAHAEEAFKNGADMYLASVAKPAKGVAKATERLSELARKHAVPVLMSNAVGYCDNFESAGCSSIWNAQGDLVAQLGVYEEGILVFDTGGGAL